MIKAIIFDMDHTLYDRNGTYANMGDSFYSEFRDFIHKDKSKDELIRILQKSDQEGIYCGGWEAIFEKACQYGAFEREPHFDKFYSYILEWFPQCMQAYEDTYDILQWCKQSGYMTGIITNGTEELQQKKIKALQLDLYVDPIMIGGVIGYQKPEIEPFLMMSSKLHLHPAEMIYVGDNPVNDIDASRRAGLTPIWMRSIGTWPQDVEKAKYEVESLSDLPEIIAAIRQDHSIARPAAKN